MRKERVLLRSLGHKIKEMRKSFGLTQEKFAEEIKVSLDTVKNWEQGFNYPSIDILVKISDYFKCDFDYLLGQQDTPNKTYKHFSEETGLSYDAVETLLAPNKNGHCYGALLSDLLEDDRLLAQIALCCNADYSQIAFFNNWDALAPVGSNRHICRPDYIRQSNEMELYRSLCDFINNIRTRNGLDNSEMG